MLIECTFCHAKAKIPDSKEGAKVRCGECGKIYVARDPNAKASGKSSPTPYVIAGAALVGIVGVWLLVNSQKGGGAKAPVEAPKVAPAPPKVDRTGYDSEFVRVVRDLYDAAFAFNTGKVKTLIHLPKVVERLRATPGQEALPAYDSMTPLERDDTLNAVVKEFMEGEGDAGIAKWRPFNGQVESEGDSEIVIHVQVGGRTEANMAENRTLEWKLAKDKDGKWKAWSWERWISPDEARAGAGSRNKEISKVTVDGATLYQAEPRPLPHLEDTPPEMRKRIDDLVTQLLDFKLKPRQNDAAGRDLVAIGKPALPILLTKMYEIHVTDDESVMKLGKVHYALRDITGYDPGFSVSANDPDSNMKREVAVKAWFAWYLRKGQRFEERKEGVDLLEGLIEPTERDKRQIEKDKNAAKPGG